MKTCFSGVRRGLSRAWSLGFSLVEMSVALVIVGILSFALWKILPQLRAVDDSQPVAGQLALADEAIIGFVMANHRLPCPDTDGDGMENVEVFGGCAVVAGEFPRHTLGVSLPRRLRYGAYQDGSLALSLTRAEERHSPLLPPLPTGGTEFPLTGDNSYDPTGYDGSDFSDVPSEYMPDLSGVGSAAILNLSTLSQVNFVRADPGFAGTRVNGLDFCAALRDAQSASNPMLTSNGVTVAYALAHPGATDANGDGSVFDGTNESFNFETPDSPSTAIYDDQVLAVGFGELAARLSCTSTLSRANAAGHAARAAFDHYRFALAYLQMRAFLLDMAYLDLQSAYSGVVFAAVNLVSAIASSTMITVSGILTADEAVGIAILAAATVLAVASIGEAIAEVVLAVPGLSEAEDGVREAAAARIEAEVYAHKMLLTANETARYAVALDTKGLLP